MNNHAKVQNLIKKLYGELIEIKPHSAVGWYTHHYSIIRPDDMDVDTFVSLFEKIANDYPNTRLNTIEKTRYCEITNHDLTTIDKNDLHIIILTSDIQNMDKLVKKMTLERLQNKKS